MSPTEPFKFGDDVVIARSDAVDIEKILFEMMWMYFISGIEMDLWWYQLINGWDNFTNGKRGMYRNNIELYKPLKPIILNIAGTADLF